MTVYVQCGKHVEITKRIEQLTLKHKTMTKKLTKKLTNLYVVAKDSELLFTDAVYYFKTAESVCSIAKEQGYKDAKVITVAYAIKNGYQF